MAYTTIKKPSDYFDTRTYSASGAGSVSDVSFQPDFIWFKNRTIVGDHGLFDAIRGVTKYLQSNNSSTGLTGNGTSTDFLSFDTNGFTYGVNSQLDVASGTPCTWLWKANGAGSANTDGTINTTVSVNTTSGFSIVKWTGNSTAGQTIGHGLGVTPKVVIIKRLSGSAQSWICKFPTATDGYLALDTSDAISASSGWLPVSSSLITLANNWSAYNNNGNDFIAYCFADVQGYSKFSSYVGNGNADGSFIYTGFLPSFVMVKRTDNISDWQIQDNKRIGYNVNNYRIFGNTSETEYTSGVMDFVSNGFKFRGTPMNTSGGNFIYMAFAEAPLVGDNPATAR